MNSELYYNSYEQRYQTVYQAGVARWGHSPKNEELISVLTEWVEQYSLRGKKVVEFACGEGASGVILSELGCIYHGVDIAPSAIEKTQKLISKYPNARVSLLDMVKETVEDKYDAALDVTGLHMLITDLDRNKYLSNAYSSLKKDSPMLFFKESYRANSYSGAVKSIDDWYMINDIDYITPQPRNVKVDGKDVEVFIPVLPARAKNENLYIQEMINVGFVVDRFQVNGELDEIQYSANIYVHKSK